MFVLLSSWGITLTRYLRLLGITLHCLCAFHVPKSLSVPEYCCFKLVAKALSVLIIDWGWYNPPPTPTPSRANYGVSFVNICEKNWPRYNGTALYFALDMVGFCSISTFWTHKRLKLLTHIGPLSPMWLLIVWSLHSKQHKNWTWFLKNDPFFKW